MAQSGEKEHLITSPTSRHNGKSPYQSDTVNIEDLITNYTWKRFVKSKPLLRRPFYRKSYFTIDFNWAYLDFKHETTKFNIRKDSVISHQPEVATGSQESKLSRRAGEDRHGNKNVVLYKSTYANDTPLDQHYNFNTTRVTKASCHVEIQNTYTKGTTYNIELTIPLIYAAVSAGRSSSEQLSISDKKGESFEETMTWALNHDVKVAKGHTVEVTMAVSERNSMADFEIKTTVSLPDGKDLPVYVRRVSDNSIVYVDMVNDLAFVFANVANDNDNVTLEKVKDQTRGLLRKNVIFTTNGSCKSVSWKKHDVHVKSVLSSPLKSLGVGNGETISSPVKNGDATSSGVGDMESSSGYVDDSASTSSGVGDSKSTSAQDEDCDASSSGEEGKAHALLVHKHLDEDDNLFDIDLNENDSLVDICWVVDDNIGNSSVAVEDDDNSNNSNRNVMDLDGYLMDLDVMFIDADDSDEE